MIAPKRPPSASDVASHYDELDVFYREIWNEHVHHGLWARGDEPADVAVRQLVDVVAAEAEIGYGDEVLDIGSGYGAAARQIAFDYGALVTGITLSPAQHEYAASRRVSGTNPHFILGDWMENELPSEAFDAAYAIESVSHMPDIHRFASEARRVLRPGGRLVVCAWMAGELAGEGAESTGKTEVVASSRTAAWKRRLLLEPICTEGRLHHLSTATEYVDAIERAGLALVEFRDLSQKVRRTWTLALRRTLARIANDSAARRYVFSSRSGQRVFVLTMLRLWLAYRVDAMRYCLVKARRD